MFDTMTLTKIASGVCGAFLILLLGQWVGREIYATGGHGEASYVIEIEDAEVASAEDEVPFTDLIAQADLGKGAKVFKKCSSCHKLEAGANATGPYLYGVVGREIAAADGFGYSGALAGMGGEWGVDELNAFLEKPNKFAAGTSMSFAGLKKPQDRADVIAYLDSIDN